MGSWRSAGCPPERRLNIATCSVELSPTHPHLVEPETRKLLCACQACAILFSGQAETKYRRATTSCLFA